MRSKNLPLVTLLTFFLGANLVLAHFTGVSAVDAGEIRWGGSTTYATQLSSAITKWNDLGAVNIAPDNAWTYEDLRISDVNLPNVTYYGIYQASAGTDNLKFNTAKLSGKTSNEKLYVALHELGHSLGLNHSGSGNVMGVGTGQTFLGAHDIEDYNTLY